MVEYFEELPNRQAPLNPPDIKAAHTDFPIGVTPPTIEKIMTEIIKINCGKAARFDMSVEAITSDVEVTANTLHTIQEDLEGRTSADRLEEGYHIKIPKKGYLRKCESCSEGTAMGLLTSGTNTSPQGHGLHQALYESTL
ncbi:unnamed protein product [Schistosoma curassoni]|uniref:Reverse transcriptase domain-containing protein n=1 Tax=Schistosoma curassoni TaxID=6186 RepID=A0A183KI58_9TREM|nr:unnamed protein product [Schistosoma curassoni]